MNLLDNIYYKLPSKATGLVLDANSKGEVYTLKWNGGDFQKWVFENIGDGFYKIIHKPTGRVLDSNAEGKVYTHAWNGGDFQKWSVKSQDDKICNLVSKATNRFLDSNSDKKVYTLPGNGGNHQLWLPEIATHKFQVNEDGIVYTQAELPKKTTPVAIISKKVWKNNSPAKITEVIKKSITKTSTFQWGFKESLKIGAKAKFEAKIPFIGSAETEVSTEFGFEANQTWTTTTSETYEISQQITLDSRSAIEVSAWVDWANNYKTPFTLTLWISAVADTTNGSEQPLSAEQIIILLEQSGFDGKIIDKSTRNKLLVSLDGEFMGSYGMTTQIDIREIPFETAPRNAFILTASKSAKTPAKKAKKNKPVAVHR